jgi:hypothetical protein
MATPTTTTTCINGTPTCSNKTTCAVATSGPPAPSGWADLRSGTPSRPAEIPSITEKDAWALRYTASLSDPDFATGTPEADRAFLRDLIAF